MTLTVLLPLLAWISCFTLLCSRGMGWRTAFLAASVAWGIAAAVLTELFSLFAALNRPALALGWGALASGCGLLCLRNRGRGNRVSFPALQGAEKLVLGAVCAIMAGTLVTAVVSPPNNWDSMTYHMSRVMHWIQNGSVAHFPTNTLRQLELNPWAEYAILHLQLLGGGDHAANLVQWYCMAGCVVAVSLIAKVSGAEGFGQLLAALVAVTIPMAILQSSSTQNDLAVSFWLACFVFFGMMSAREKNRGWTLLMSCSLGLAVLTKGTAYIVATPFMLWFMVRDVKVGWREAGIKWLSAGCLVLALNFGHYLRNWSLFGNPLTSGNDAFSNGLLTPAVVVSNLTRNLALHLWTPSDVLDRFVFGAMDALHSLLGLGLSDPATTWPGTSFAVPLFSLHEDLTGNPLHLLLFLIVTILLVFRKKHRNLLPYALSVWGGVLLFCIMLRWQPWGSRLHLPLFVLFSPLAGVVVSELRSRGLALGLAAALSLASLLWVVCNSSRSLVSWVPHTLCSASSLTTPRWSQYFVNNPPMERILVTAAEVINSRKFRNVGLRYETGDTWEYPLWVMTREKGAQGPRIEHVGVANRSSSIPARPFRPDVILSISGEGEARLELPRPQ